MKNVKFYPKRIAIVISMVLAIPLASIIAHVTDIHLPTGEEINMIEGTENSEFQIRHEPEENVVVPKDETIELTEEEKDFEKERVSDGCNGTEKKKKE